MSNPLIFLGGGGHATVLLDIARLRQLEVIAVCDPGLAAEGLKQWRQLPIWGSDQQVWQQDPAECLLVNAIGGLPGSTLRQKLFTEGKARGYHFASLFHPSAVIASCAQLGEGCQIMAGAVLQPECRLGDNVLVNTRSSVDHHSQIASHCHLAPGAVICGNAAIGQGVQIGPGAVIGQGVSVGEQAVIGAGTAAVRDVAANSRLINARPRIQPGVCG